MGDLAQLPPVMDIPLYARSSHGSALWHNFNTVVTLSIVFHQQGNDPSQVTFRKLLTNIKNAIATIEDWKLLMSRTESLLYKDELSAFKGSMYLFETNQLASLHNLHSSSLCKFQ